MNIKEHHIAWAIRKSKSSVCRHKIVAFGYNKKGDLLYKSTNQIRPFIIPKKSSGDHAEQLVMKKAGPSLHHIFIFRVTKANNFLQISPCEKCQNIAKKLGVKIYTVYPTKDEEPSEN